MSVVKYYVAKLKEQNGQYEYSHFFRFTSGVGVSPYEHADDVASQFYGDDADPDLQGYYFNGGEVYVQVAYVQEIPEGTYIALKGIMPEL